MTTHRVGTWNVEYGHDPVQHVAAILYMFDWHCLDVLALQETADYGDELERRAHKGYGLVWHRGAGPKAQQAILVRDPRLLGDTFAVQGGGAWSATDGSSRGPMWPVACTYDGVVYVSAHAPVSVKWSRRRPHRVGGPARRAAAYIGHTRALRRILAGHARVVVLADWNATPTTRGPWTPRWLARKTGAAFVRPFRSTGHGEIDYALVKGVRGTFHTLVRPGLSDHGLVIIEVET